MFDLAMGALGAVAGLMANQQQQNTALYPYTALNAQSASGMQSASWSSPMSQEMLNAYLGNRIINMPAAQHKDCQGCGAPLKAYDHHCEYCRRAA